MPVQLPFFQPQSEWRPPNLAELPSWDGAKRVGIDIETCDPNLKKLGPGVRRDGKIVGVSFALEFPDVPNLNDAPRFYLPIDHEAGDNVDRETALRYLRDQAKNFKGDVVGANMQYDLDYLLEYEIEFLRKRFFRDVQVAEPLLDELQMSYSLQAIAERWGEAGKDEEALEAAAKSFGIDPKAEMWKLPARHVGLYAEEDALLPLKLIRRQERKLQEVGVWDVYDLESRLLPGLVDMRRRGVRVDNDHLDRVEAMSLREEEDSLAEVSRLSGVTVTRADINKARVVGRAIEEATGLTLPRTKTGPSVAAKVLAKIDHPMVTHLLRAKRFNKLRNTFVKSIRAHQVNGRIHCTFNQLRRTDDGSGDDSGTITGRLSSTGPNLQQQPARDPEIGKIWRTIYIPDEGAQWACLDFSSQEPRWVVHFAEISGCTGAKEAADRYRENPKTDLYVVMREMVGWDCCEKVKGLKECPDHPDADGRDKSKTLYLGLIYGMGGAKMCDTLKLPTEWWTAPSGKEVRVAGPEGKAIMRQFNAGAPFLSELSNRAIARAKSKGVIKTVLGRQLHFPRDKSGRSFDFTHKAMNKLIQGSSADQTKKAMVVALEAGLKLQLQVHDELNLSVACREEADQLSEIMENCVPCNVPHVCEPNVAENWGAAK